MNPSPRFVVSDEEGPVRKFYTKKEASEWAKTRPELILEALPKPKAVNMFEITEEAVF
jgi:hypothetical protein